MWIISTHPPDFWYESDDISDHSVILIRRESITCCGFLGGDSIAIIPSINQFIRYIKEFRPVLPWSKRQQGTEQPENPTLLFQDIISELNEGSPATHQSPELLYEILVPVITRFNEEVWLAADSDPFRFSLDIWKDMNSFLEQSGYTERLLATFRWWYQNEASVKERLQVPDSLLSGSFRYPDHSEHLIRAVNLYNHGTYELT
jgi:hypothetical protein